MQTRKTISAFSRLPGNSNGDYIAAVYGGSICWQIQVIPVERITHTWSKKALCLLSRHMALIKGDQKDLLTVRKAITGYVGTIRK